MQKYKTVNKLSATECRRLTGVQKDTFVENVGYESHVSGTGTGTNGRLCKKSILGRVI